MKTATELFSQAQDELARFGPNACLTLKCVDVLVYLGGKPADLRTYQVEIIFDDESGSISFPIQATHIADACAQAWRDIETRGIKAGAVHVFDATSEIAKARADAAAARRSEKALREDVTEERLMTYRTVARLEREIERLEGLLNPKPEADGAELFGAIEGLDLDVGPGVVEHATLSGEPCTCPTCRGIRELEVAS